jgi:hypothetical protein
LFKDSNGIILLGKILSIANGNPVYTESSRTSQINKTEIPVWS